MTNLRADIPLLQDNGGVFYLDNAATALMPKQVLAAVADYDNKTRANVGRGVYAWAADAGAVYESARAVVAAALNAPANEVIFCGGATAALNMAAIALSDTLTQDDAIWLAADNHHSNWLPWQNAAIRSGAVLRQLPATKNGSVDIAAVAGALAADDKKAKVLAVSHAGNVTGAVTPLPELAAIAKNAGALLAVDGAQFMPHAFPDIQKCGADIYAFSGHKCYAPNGIGVLWAKSALLESWQPAFGGGGMAAEVGLTESSRRPAPHGWEAGTPPISQAVGLAAAIEWMRQWPQDTESEVRALCAEFKQRLLELPDVAVYGGENSTIVSFAALPTKDGNAPHPHDICQLIAERGVASRGGHHCALPLMKHLNIDGCVRFSFAPYNNAADARAAFDAVSSAVEFLR